MKFKLFILLSFLIIILFACDQKSSEKEAYSFNDADTLPIKYAEGFRIINFKNFKLLEIKNPWQGASNITIQYLLYSDKIPEEDIFPEATRIKIPLKNIACLSTTHIGFLEQIDELNSIKGISNPEIVYNSFIRERINENNISDIGYNTNLNYEVLLDINPDVIMTYSVGSEYSNTKGKLEELGLTMVINAEYLESHPLGKAEWIKFVSAFYNKENLATEIFKRKEKEYSNLTKLTRDLEVLPTIMTGLPWQGTWYISGGHSYAAKLIEDAGGKFIWSDNTSNEAIPLSIESVFNSAQNAGIWINSGYATNMEYLLNTDERILFFKPYSSGNVFNNNKRINSQGGNDYWESGIINPEIILKDLIKIFHPGILPDSALVYYNHLH